MGAPAGIRIFDAIIILGVCLEGAVPKAPANLTAQGAFDLCTAETVTTSKGNPRAQVTPALLRINKEAGVISAF